MSGETEKEVSAWTIDSLRYHLEQIASDLDLRYQQRFVAQEKAVGDALAARDKEVDAALAAQEKAVEAALSAHDKMVTLIRETITAQITGETSACLERVNGLEKATRDRFVSQERNVTTAQAAQEKRFDSVNEFRAQLRDQQVEFMRRDEYQAAHIALIDKVDSGATRFAERLNVLENRVNLMTGQQVGSQEARTGQRLDNSQLIAVVSVVLVGISIAVGLILALNG